MNECAAGEQSPVPKPIFDSLSPKSIALFSFLTVCFFASARLAHWMPFVQPYGTPIWLPAGGAVAVLLVFGNRAWPTIVIGSFLGHVTVSGLAMVSFESPVAAVLEGLAGAYLVNKFAHGVKAFDTAKDTFLFVLFTIICAPTINVTFAFLTRHFWKHLNLADSAHAVLLWWLAHSIGVLVVAPFLILMLRPSHHPLNMPEVVELTILLTGLILVCLLVFGPLAPSLNKQGIVRSYMCIPFLIWAAFRFCPLEAAGTTFILFGSAIWGTMHGYGQFVSKSSVISLVLMDAFVGVTGTMTLVVAAVGVQRRRIELELLAVQSLLQSAVEVKNRELEVTAQALELEIAGHMHTRKTLRENQERLRLIAENEGKAQEVQIQRERME
jgi:integral membrane sensor domain MASE1